MNPYAVAAIAAIVIYGAHGAYKGAKKLTLKSTHAIEHVIHHPKQATKAVIAHETK